MRRTRKLGTTLGFAALAIALITVALWSQQIERVAIPEDRTMFVAAFVAAAVLGLSAFVVGTRWYGGVAAVLALFVGALLPLTVAVSRQDAPKAIAVGDIIPPFQAVDAQGELFDAERLHGHILLVKFFRAHW